MGRIGPAVDGSGSPVRLGFHYHIQGRSEGSRLLTAGYQARFLEGLAAHVDTLTCYLHAAPPSPSEVVVSAPNVELVDLGPKRSLPRRVARPRLPSHEIARSARGLDALLIRSPTPLGHHVAQAAGVPTALLLVGDYVASGRTMSGPLPNRAFVRVWAPAHARSMQRLGRRSLVMTNSEALQDRYRSVFGPMELVRTTTIRAEDVSSRADSCATEPFRLLFVGRLDLSKGLVPLLEAVGQLRRSGLPVHLEMVGASEGGNVEGLLTARAEALGIAAHVTLCGFKPVGPQLFGHYRRADVFVSPSTGAEGFPRVIWEAMAHGLPVVATDVGGLRAAVGGAAALVPPGEVAALADAVRNVIIDGSRRREMIQAGRNLAAEVTIEHQAGRLVRAVEAWLTEGAR